MGLCIYTGADDSKAKFSDAEHVFPKCIGRTNTLPLGSVSDEINKYFSKLELGFARQYPPVVISRMFSETMGKKNIKTGIESALSVEKTVIQVLCLTLSGKEAHTPLINLCFPVN